MTLLETRIRRALDGMSLEQPTIDIEGVPPAVFVVVVSSSFTRVDEAERQRLIWSALREELEEPELAAIEFAFTYSPDEIDQEGAAELA